MKSIKHHIVNNPLNYSKLFIVLGFCCALFASLTSGKNLEGFPWDYSYYHLNAISFFLYISSLYLTALTGTPQWSNKWKTFLLIVLLSSATTIGDELAGTGNVTGLHDLIRFASVLIIVIIRRYKLIKKWRTRLKHLLL